MTHTMQPFSTMQMATTATTDVWRGPNPMSPGDDVNLVNEIKALQADRQRHADAIAKIDATLTRISSMLASVLHAEGQGTGSPTTPAPAGRPRRRYRKLPQKGEEFVLDLLKQQGSATTREVNAAWKAQGRGGVANNTLARLVKRDLVLREPLENQVGSRYRLNPNSDPSRADAV
jgi:hypothetical protein